MYILEGNIGAGKSTFLDLVQEHYPLLKVVLEPVNNWKNQSYGQSLLANFYQDPKRWAYTLETMAMACRIRDHLEHQDNKSTTTIMERSVFSGHYCFAYNGHLSGFMSKLEWEIYSKWFNFLVEKKCIKPKGFIYLQVSPYVAYERIKKRNRPEEKQMGFDYIEQIHLRHEEFLIQNKHNSKHLKNVPILTLNCDEDFESNKLQLHKLFEKLEIFLNQTQPHITANITKNPYARV